MQQKQSQFIIVVPGQHIHMASLTAQNPRRHAAGKPFHAFLTGWLDSSLASLRFICTHYDTVRYIWGSQCSAWGRRLKPPALL